MVSNYSTSTDNSLSEGMLSSTHIAYCINKYEIITNFNKSCLGPASYHMRLGEPVLTWRKGNRIEYKLGDEEDNNRNIRKNVELLPNSLTFLTTYEEFRLTKDIIARFNLKSKWVHRGLLLGTGPIVDPQLHGRLLIPVHNFSSQTITINFKETFISVEFTKTLNPHSNLEFVNGKKIEYVDNPHWKLDFEGYRERIANNVVESSVQSEFEKNRDKIKFQYWASLVAASTLLIALASLTYGTWKLINDAHDKADDAYNLVKQYEENGADFRTFALKSNYVNLKAEITTLKERNTSLQDKVFYLRRDNNLLVGRLEKYQKESELLQKRIEKLENLSQ